eukprot:TRINITY_DN534_c0_g1_i1.p1 TRINITY_DN534_c0_g1~~TRINITY_DN534_c0_g1_i1.p1  ORF type:complete len:1080 (-),score=152.48 TRINITY_DN534_c0_g1_i1:17391-20630(-)
MNHIKIIQTKMTSMQQPTEGRKEQFYLNIPPNDERAFPTDLQEIPADEELYPCAYCKKMTLEFCCQDCGEVYYCSEEHAKLHWKVHKEECKGRRNDASVSPVASLGQASAGAESMKPQVQYSPISKQHGKYEPRLTQVSSSSMPAGKRFSGMEKIQLLGNRRLTQPLSDLGSPALRLLQRHKTEGKDEDDDFQSDENAPLDSNLSKPKARRRVLYHLWKGNYDRAKQYAEGQYHKARSGLDKAENDAEYSAGHLDDIMQDFLMYAKCLLLSEGNIETVREILNILSENVLGCIRINYKEVKNSIEDAPEGGKDFKKLHAKDFDMYSMSGKTKSGNMHRRTDTTDFSDIKRILHMHGIIAAMYKVLENQVESEKTYAKYCKIVEKLFGIQSVEASNCYYYIGIYYYEEQQYEKALICMKKALFNRSRELGDRHVSCGDCHFNIGIIYKKQNQLLKAKAELEQALSIRREGIGKSSLPCAGALEELGKLALETGDYKSAFTYLQECYEIRKKLLKNPKHQEITRVSLLLIFLNRKIEKELRKTAERERKHLERTSALTATLSQAYSVNSQWEGKKAEPRPDPVSPVEEVKRSTLELEENEYTPKTTPIALQEDFKGTDVAEGVSLLDFIPKGFQQIFKYHTEEPQTENIIDSIVLILSLDKVQTDYLNKSQIERNPNTPLFLIHEFKKMLSPFQMLLYSRTELHRIPRKFFLKKSEGPVEATNLRITEAIRRHSLLKTREGSTLNEENIYKLLQSNSDFYKVLNSWQVEILNKVTTYKLPLGLFFRSIQESQIYSFEEIIKEELRALQDHDYAKKSYEPLPLFYSGNGKTSEEPLIAPKADLQEELIKFIENKLAEDMLGKIMFDINEEFCKNLNHDQMMLISQINTMKNTMAKELPEMTKIEKDKAWGDFRKYLVEFIKSLNQKEVYQFAIANSFMIGIKAEAEEESKPTADPPLIKVTESPPTQKAPEKYIPKPHVDPNVQLFGGDSDGESSGDEEDPEFNVLDSVQEENKLVQNILQNPAVLEEMKKTLPKSALKTIAEHPEIVKQFLVKPPKSPSMTDSKGNTKQRFICSLLCIELR